MSDLKAIETIYQGYRFRSRLEARWAVFFDAVGLKWEYEYEGFELREGLRYLPDFFLPDLKYWIEIKGQPLTQREWEKCTRFHEQSEHPLFLLIGMPGGKEVVDEWPDFTVSYTGIRLHEKERREGYIWTQCRCCSLIGLCPDYRHFRPLDTFEELFCTCYKASLQTPLWGGTDATRLSSYLKYDLLSNGYTGSLESAYTVARSARFE